MAWQTKRKKLKQPGDDKFYDEVARELQDKPMMPGLWTKAFAEMGGDDAKARALYIKYRVAQLETTANQEQSIKQGQVSKAKKQQVMSAFRKFVYVTIGCVFLGCGILLFCSGMAMTYLYFFPSVPSDRDEGIGVIVFIALLACVFTLFGFWVFAKAGIKLR